MKVIERFIPEERRPKYDLNGQQVEFKMVPEYITIHETANTAVGANDLAHANLQFNGNARDASWHFQIDEDSCYQSLPCNIAGMHAGDGWNGTGNRKSIAIEICVNKDGNYEKAIKNAADLVSQLMKQYNIPIEKVVPHRKWSGKNCPTKLLPRWDEFIRSIGKEELTNVIKYIYTGGHAHANLQKVHTYLFKAGHGFDVKRGADGSIIFLVGPYDTGARNYKDSMVELGKFDKHIKLLTREEAAEWRE